MAIGMLVLDPETAKRERERRFWLDTAAGLGGIAGGAAIGTLLINPVNFIQQRAAEKAAETAGENFKRNKEILQTLVELHSKKLSWDDITPEARPTMERLYHQHQDLLNDPFELTQRLREKPPAEFIRMPGVPRFRMSQLLPTKEMLARPLQTIQHPLPSTLGLLGMGLAEYAMNRHHEQRLHSLMMAQQNPEGGNDHD